MSAGHSDPHVVCGGYQFPVGKGQRVAACRQFQNPRCLAPSPLELEEVVIPVFSVGCPWGRPSGNQEAVTPPLG